ncbi:hypothetical protein F8S13_26795 [Chloroflexia bacterium SDU3-3]|nr:hypothetical protein F8S13_26795 [Chloroflexia bacterium SDU3-3]
MAWNRRLMTGILSAVVMIGSSFTVAQAANPSYDDTYTNITYTGTWQAVTGVIGAVNQTLHWSNVTGSEASFSCPAGGSGAYGVAFYLTASKAYNRGIANVWFTSPFYPGEIRGLTKVDLFEPGVTRQVRIPISTDMPLGTGSPYTIHVQVSGEKNISSSGTFVDIDSYECDLS